MAKILHLQFLALLLGKFLLAQECPQPSVKKRTIIRAKESRENGAVPIGKFVVDSARQCYLRCCKETDCNIAIMYYKQVIENELEVMEKHCFLFDCKSPSVCTYDNHERYAVIEVPKLASLQTTDFKLEKLSSKSHQSTLLPPTSSTPTKMEKPNEEKCPPGSPVAMCSEDPCEGRTCKEHKNALCRPSYCGGCFAKFYDQQSGEKLACTIESKNKNEEVVNVASTDYQETPEDKLPSLNLDKTKDPYFQSERRKWVDGDETGHVFNGTSKDHTVNNNKNQNVDTTTNPDNTKERVIVVNNSFMSIPVFIALCICILLVVGLIYRFKFSSRGKPKKVPVDDGDYLINGMYL